MRKFKIVWGDFAEDIFFEEFWNLRTSSLSSVSQQRHQTPLGQQSLVLLGRRERIFYTPPFWEFLGRWYFFRVWTYISTANFKCRALIIGTKQNLPLTGWSLFTTSFISLVVCRNFCYFLYCDSGRVYTDCLYLRWILLFRSTYWAVLNIFFFKFYNFFPLICIDVMYTFKS